MSDNDFVFEQGELVDVSNPVENDFVYIRNQLISDAEESDFSFIRNRGIGGIGIPDFVFEKGFIWWPFDEGSGGTVNDALDGGHHGSINGPSWLSNDWHGGNALSSTGSGNFVSTTTWGDWFSQINTNFWLAFTVSTTHDGTNSQDPQFIGESHTFDQTEWIQVGMGINDSFFGTATGDQMGMSLRDSAGDIIAIETDTSPLTDGSPHRYVVNKVSNSGSGAMEWYVDGQPVPTSLIVDQGFLDTGTIHDMLHPAYLFAENDDGDLNNEGSGIMDNILIGQPGTTLTEEEIAEDWDWQPWT